MLIDNYRPKVAVINRSDTTGGAAVVSLRLTEGLRTLGADARMVVAEKLTDRPYVELVASSRRTKLPFLTERLRIFAANGFNRKTLFKIDTASDGLPLWRHPVVEGADVICLNWVNQGMLSLKGLRKLIEMGKPIVWVMHDMWNLTGVCHHAGDCDGYMAKCGLCPLLGKRKSPHDISRKTFLRKKRVYDFAREAASACNTPLTFVAVSNWVGELARKSPLLGDMPVVVIPNAFPTSIFPSPEQVAVWKKGKSHEYPGEFVIAMGAARLDDPVKGLPLLVESTRQLRALEPELAERTRLVTFGNLRDSHALDIVDVRHTHLGPVDGTQGVMEVLRGADAVVSSSLYETLPGTLVEGQACGAIPVSFNRGGQADIIDHLHSGYIAKMEENDILSARNLAQGIIWASRQGEEIIPRLARNVADRFSAEAVATRYLDLFRSISGEREPQKF